MTEAEWLLFTGELEATFRWGLPSDREEALRGHLGKLPFELARSVVRRLVVGGQADMPMPGEFVRALRVELLGSDGEVDRLLRGESREENTARLMSRYRPSLVAPEDERM